MKSNRFAVEAESLRALGDEMLQGVMGGSEEYPGDGGATWHSCSASCTMETMTTCATANTCALQSTCSGNTCPSPCSTFFGCPPG